MVYRVFVEKRPEISQARTLYEDIKESLLIKNLSNIRVFNRYDLDNISEKLFKEAVAKVLSEPQLDIVYDSLPEENAVVFAVEYLAGQYDQRADSASQCIQILSQENAPLVRTAFVYMLYGNLSKEDVDKIKKYLINPVDSREASLEKPKSLKLNYDIPKNIEVLEGFIDFNEQEKQAFLMEKSLAMDIDDLSFCQNYFKSEKRNPTITEIRMIDTYWSDHCRHTTFLTNIDNVSFEEDYLRAAWERYLSIRNELGRTKPITLMDIATISVKYLSKKGLLDKLDESDEINACTVKIKVEVENKFEDWLLLFKNETHNHPTEIEPFGGAATCIGGAIRDPLSGRAYVYAAMRVTGASDPTVLLSETIKGKLSQKKLVTTAANGYSSYGNQIGLATGLVDEIYHKGYMAKRLEIGAVIGAVPSENVRREVPKNGDLIVLLGGRTGRDGCGGATGSSKAHKLESIETCGAEVQKGNAPEERKLQRFFRNKEVTSMIKRCNDFGAGGVSVAIGELADGIEIDLNKVPKKYEGLDGTEIAISESQERMAVVIEKENLEKFLDLAHEENLEATCVATVTADNRLKMKWNENFIVDLSREFLNSSGAKKHINIEVEKFNNIENKKTYNDFVSEFKSLASDLNVCSKRGLSERFDSTIGAGTVLMPFGGKYQRTPIQAMANKISIENKDTKTVSIMSYGYNPYITEKNPYKGAYLAVVESVAKLIATGASRDEVYLTFQEYFERLGKDSKRWGKPLAALLGAFEAQLNLGIVAIGGKDSMSGSFENLDVPPTLVSFAVTTDNIDKIKSPEYKNAGNKVFILYPKYEDELPQTKSLIALFDFIFENNDKFKSIYTPTYGGVAEAVLKQSMGNGFGFVFNDDFNVNEMFSYAYGAFLVEVSNDFEILKLEKLGITKKLVGTISVENEFKYKDLIITTKELNELYENRLEKVFKCNDVNVGTNTLDIESLGRETLANKKNNIKSVNIGIQKPKILIPVFSGTNCEYDSAKAASKAGLEPEIVVIKNLNSKDISDSIDFITKKINETQIVFIPGGFSGGDEPDGSAKFIVSFFRNAKVKEAITRLLEKREGLVAGICNGFQALVKLGLLPFGKIIDTDETSPSVTFNTIGRHQSKIVYTKIVSNNSPWLSNTKVGEVYAVPISHGEGRFIWNEEKTLELARNAQIATQYVDLSKNATMDIQYNPNGSLFGIEGLISPCGKVFGKMGHSERVEEGLYKNVIGHYDIGMFRGVKSYFKY